MQTSENILAAAERLFAERGYQATSVRDITDLAEVNIAAVNYHFGSKEQLLRSVTDRIVEPLNARRNELLDALLSGDEPPSTAELIEGFVRPDVEAMRRLEERVHAVRFVGRIYSDDAIWIRQMAAAQFAEVGARFLTALASVLPDVSEDELRWRLDQLVAVVVNLFATYPTEGLTGAEAEHTVARLVGFLAPAMQAPAPIEPEE